ncbi:MAG: O-antigen ligase family protein, partial [Candidatus Peribacteraceae bacterium]|nr:O-antigen ligase family protein [Candidatus Peribacteraceae bacterium]
RFSSPTQHIGLGSRAVIWDASADMFIHRPVGYGLDSMALFSPQFIDKEIFEYEPLETVVDRAHSKPFDLFITLGILGFLAYYTLLTKHLHSLWKRREEPIVITSFLSLLGASICLLFSFDTAVTHVFFWMIMGLSLGAILPTRKTKKPRLECSIYLGSAFLVLISVIAFSQWNGARFRSFQSIRLFNDGYLNDYLKPGQRAVYLFPFDRSILISNAQNMISEQSWLSASANANFDDIERRGQLQDSVRSTLKLHSFLTSNNDGIGDLLSAWNESLRFLDFESKVVDDLIHEALYKNPMHVPTLRTGALIYNSIGMHEHSVSMINKVIEVLPDFFYDDKSERRRILLKENKWLLELL